MKAPDAVRLGDPAAAVRFHQPTERKLTMEYYAIVRRGTANDGTNRYASVTATEYTCPDGCFVRDAQRKLLDEALGAVQDDPDDIRVVVRGESQVDLCIRFCGCAEPDVMTAVRFSRRDVPSPEDLRV